MADWRARALEALDTLPPDVDPAELATLAPLVSALGMKPFDEVRETLEAGLIGVVGERLAAIVLDGAMHIDDVAHRLERLGAWAALKHVAGGRADGLA